MIFFYNPVETISRLSSTTSLDEAFEENIALPFGVKIITRQSLPGRTLSWIYSLCDFISHQRRGFHEEKHFHNTVIKVKEIYQCAVEKLSDEKKPLTEQTVLERSENVVQWQARLLLGSALDEKFSVKVARVYNLFFPSTGDSQQYDDELMGISFCSAQAAETVLEDLSGYSQEETREFIQKAYAWKTTEDIRSSYHVLNWIQDLNHSCLACISPRAFIKVVKNALKDNSEAALDLKYSVWRVLWNLYDAGLRIGKAETQHIVRAIREGRDHVGVRYIYRRTNDQDEENSTQKIQVTYDRTLSEATSDLFLRWYTSSSTPEIALVESEVPFLLGLWAYQQQFGQFLFPPLPVQYISDDGHTIIVQKPVSTVASIISSGTSYEESIRLGSMIAQRLISLDHMVEVDLHSISIMEGGSLACLCPLRNRDSRFSLPFSWIKFEKQIRKLFSLSDERVVHIYRDAGVWKHPSLIWMDKVIISYGFSLTLGDIDRECRLASGSLAGYMSAQLVQETFERFCILLQLYRLLEERNNYSDNGSQFFKNALFVQKKRAEIFTKDMEQLYQAYLKEFPKNNSN